MKDVFTYGDDEVFSGLEDIPRDVAKSMTMVWKAPSRGSIHLLEVPGPKVID